MPFDRRINVGIDASRASPSRPTGTENYAYRVVRGILDIDQLNRYTLYHRDGAAVGQFGLRSNVCHRLVRPPRLWTHVGLSREMLRRRPDVLFVPSHVLPIVRPRHSVVTVHDLGYLYYPSAHTRLSWWYLHLSTAYHVRVATRLIADSHATKADLIERYRANPESIRVVHLAAGAEFQPVVDRARLQEVSDQYVGGEYLLAVGTVQPRKNIGGLLEAYAALRRRVQRAPSLVIAGKHGWLSAPIYARASTLGLSDAVRWVDYVPQADMPALMSGAQALVFPSFYEGFGLPALEAMSCGTPVIAANVSSLPEVLGDAAVLVDPHDINALTDAMVELLADRALRDRMREKGLARAALFSWSRCAKETLDVILDAARHDSA